MYGVAADNLTTVVVAVSAVLHTLVVQFRVVGPTVATSLTTTKITLLMVQVVRVVTSTLSVVLTESMVWSVLSTISED